MVSSLLLLHFCLATLTYIVIAGDLTSPYEKIWLWGAYNIALAAEGKTQPYLFPAVGGQRGQSANLNVGTGPDGSLTFQEFIDRTGHEGKDPCKVAGPDATRDAKTVALDLIRQEQYGLFETTTISRVKGYIYKNYPDMVTKITAMLKKNIPLARENLRKGKAGSRDIEFLLKTMDDALTRLNELRPLEFKAWVTKDIRKDPPKGFGLGKDPRERESGEGKNKATWYDTTMPVAEAEAKDRVKYTTHTPPEGEVHYKAPVSFRQLDIEATIRANPTVFPSGRAVEKFKDWVKNYGDTWVKPKKGQPKNPYHYSDASGSHFAAIKAWRKAHQDLKAAIDPTEPQAGPSC